jgi:hypothetical protein
MAAQRATSVKWNGESTWGTNVLTEAPELGALVAATITAWTMTEAHMGRLFGSLIGIKQPMTMSMYSAIRSFEVQRDLIKTASVERLPKRYAIAVTAGMSVVQKFYKTRNEFAHWIWGASTDPELKALLLVDPKYFWKLHIEQHQWWNDKRRKGAIERVGPFAFMKGKPEISRDDIWVYRLSDLQQKRREIERAYGIIEALRLLVVQDVARRRGIYHWLCSEADLQKEVKKVTDNWPRTRPVHLSRPRRGRETPPPNEAA